MIENTRFEGGYRPGDAELEALSDVEPDEEPDHPLDRDESERLFERLKSWYEEEIERQRENRVQMAMDCDYYDGMQTDAEQVAELRSRGQAPLVYNRVALALNWIIGSEVKTRLDWKVRPRAADDVKIAPIKTDLLKYVADANRSGSKRSAAFKDAVVAGVGWRECGITTDPEQEMIYIRHESWRNVIYDSRSISHDLSDARYLFRHRWVDLDVAQTMFPDRPVTLKGASKGSDEEERQGDSWYLGERLESGLTEGDSPATVYHGSGSWTASKSRRERVRLTECWYRTPVARKILRGEIGDGEAFDETNPEHVSAVEQQRSSVVDNLSMRMQTAVFCEAGLLSKGEMPYRHNRFPLTPTWCYRRDRDNAPYGMVRTMRDPQDDFNKRMSKALFLMSVNQTIFDEGSFEDEDEARIELSRPDAFVAKRRGHEVITRNGAELAPAQLALADRDLQQIEASSGVTNELLGQSTNAVSGKAVLARQNQGTVVTAPIFDRYRESFELEGQKVLSLIEQYYTTPRVVRITGVRGADKFLEINQRDPNDPTQYMNDVARTQCDFIVDEQDFRATSRQAQLEALFELLSKLPGELLPQYLDLVFDMMDTPQAEEMAKRARAMNGQDSPDGPKTPEEAAASQQRKQIEQQQQLLQMRMAIAQVTKIEAEAAKIGNTVMLDQAKTIFQKMTTLYTAMQAAQIAVMAPAVTVAGDELLGAVGFEDAGGSGIDMSTPPALPPPQPQPEMAPPEQAAGAMQGIETPAADGMQQQPMPQPVMQ